MIVNGDSGMKSKLVNNQCKTYEGIWEGERIVVRCHWDDECGNGHNSLGITGSTEDICGCLHLEILESKGIPVEIKDKARRMKFDPIEKGNVTVTYAIVLNKD